MLKTKRVYDPKSTDDGTRILVDRIWPRGIKKESASFDEWVKDLAPSDNLRNWFGHDPAKWTEFRRRYSEELNEFGKSEQLARIAQMAINGDVTLVYAAKDTEHNNARVMGQVISRLMRGEKAAV